MNVVQRLYEKKKCTTIMAICSKSNKHPSFLYFKYKYESWKIDTNLDKMISNKILLNIDVGMIITLFRISYIYIYIYILYI